LIALAAAGITRAIARLRPAAGNFAKAIVAGMLIVLTVISFRQTFIYHDLEILYRDTIVKNPTGWAAFANLSTYLDSQGRHDEALELGRDALRLGPQEPNVHNNMGVFLFKQAARTGFDPAQLQQAIAHLQDTLELDPLRIEARKNLARALVVAGRPDEALEQFQKVLEINTHHADVHFDMANLLVGRNQLPAASEHYQEALRLQPDYVEALQNLGAVYLKMRDAARAIPCLQAVLRLQPENPQARANLQYATTLLQNRDQP
jgi:tetratricopeptide (TPR) repeat protein